MILYYLNPNGKIKLLTTLLIYLFIYLSISIYLSIYLLCDQENGNLFRLILQLKDTFSQTFKHKTLICMWRFYFTTQDAAFFI